MWFILSIPGQDKASTGSTCFSPFEATYTTSPELIANFPTLPVKWDESHPSCLRLYLITKKKESMLQDFDCPAGILLEVAWLSLLSKSEQWDATRKQPCALRGHSLKRSQDAASERTSIRLVMAAYSCTFRCWRCAHSAWCSAAERSWRLLGTSKSRSKVAALTQPHVSAFHHS